MDTKNQLYNACRELKEIYGTHERVAAELGITRDHYSKVRRGAASVSSQLLRHILLLLEFKNLKHAQPPTAQA